MPGPIEQLSDRLRSDQAEVERLRAELAECRAGMLAELEAASGQLAHRTAERDRLFASSFIDHQNELDPIGSPREPTQEQSIAEVLHWMMRFELLGEARRLHQSAIAAALAEHDRRSAAEGER